MKYLDKGSAVFKNKPEDFIVEEINQDGKISEISPSLDAFENAKVDLSGINLEDRRDFIMFDLEKLNVDHFNLISILSEKLRKNSHEIGYAGTKDKLAWTCQRMSVFNPRIEEIKNFSHSGIILKNFRWGKHKIKIGDLKGNRFKVVLRDVDKEAIKILNRVRNTEFIPNFFGSQRFGSLRKDNFHIGRMILKRQYKEAVFAYLTGYGEKESKEVKEAKKKLRGDKNILSAKNYFPKELYIEHSMIEHLQKNKDDFIGALDMIGEKVILIMCQSVQSRIFNDILERGIERGIISEKDSVVIPGYNASNADNKLKKVEAQVLDENDIELDDFRNMDREYLSLLSSKRKAFFKVSDVKIDIEDDEVFKPAKKIKIEFTLGSGSYATSFLEHFFDLR